MSYVKYDQSSAKDRSFSASGSRETALDDSFASGCHHDCDSDRDHKDEAVNLAIIVSNPRGSTAGTGAPLTLAQGPNFFYADQLFNLVPSPQPTLVAIASTPRNYRRLESASSFKPLTGTLSGWNGTTTVSMVELTVSIYLAQVANPLFPATPGSFPTVLSLVIVANAPATFNGFQSIIFKFNSAINPCDRDRKEKPDFFFLSGNSGLLQPANKCDKECNKLIANLLPNSLLANNLANNIIYPFPPSIAALEARSLDQCGTEFNIFSTNILIPDNVYPTGVVTSKSSAYLGTAIVTIDNNFNFRAVSASRNSIAYPTFSLWIERRPGNEAIQTIVFTSAASF